MRTTGTVTFSEQDKKAIPRLNEILMCEVRLLDSYLSYQCLIKGLDKFGLAKEFDCFALEKKNNLEVIRRFIVAMGERPTLDRYPLPDVRGKIQDVLKKLMDLELEVMKAYSSVMHESEGTGTSLCCELKDMIKNVSRTIHALDLWIDADQVVEEVEKEEPKELVEESKEEELTPEEAREEAKVFKLA